MALLFDGTNDIVNHGTVYGSSVSVLSSAMWVNPVAIAISDGFWEKGTLTNLLKFGTHYTTNTQVDVWFNNTPILGRTDAVLANGTWTHCAFTYNGGGAANADRLQIYINGVAQTLTFEGTIPATTGASGADSVKVATNTLNGTFANYQFFDLKIWDAYLSADEIYKEAWSYRPVRTDNLRLWTPYDDGILATDYSGNGFNGTVTEATQNSLQPPNVHYADQALGRVRNARRWNSTRGMRRNPSVSAVSPKEY